MRKPPDKRATPSPKVTPRRPKRKRSDAPLLGSRPRDILRLKNLSDSPAKESEDRPRLFGRTLPPHSGSTVAHNNPTHRKAPTNTALPSTPRDIMVPYQQFPEAKISDDRREELREFILKVTASSADLEELPDNHKQAYEDDDDDMLVRKCPPGCRCHNPAIKPSSIESFRFMFEEDIDDKPREGDTVNSTYHQIPAVHEALSEFTQDVRSLFESGDDNNNAGGAVQAQYGYNFAGPNDDAMQLDSGSAQYFAGAAADNSSLFYTGDPIPDQQPQQRAIPTPTSPRLPRATPVLDKATRRVSFSNVVQNDGPSASHNNSNNSITSLSDNNTVLQLLCDQDPVFRRQLEDLRSIDGSAKNPDHAMFVELLVRRAKERGLVPGIPAAPAVPPGPIRAGAVLAAFNAAAAAAAAAAAGGAGGAMSPPARPASQFPVLGRSATGPGSPVLGRRVSAGSPVHVVGGGGCAGGPPQHSHVATAPMVTTPTVTTPTGVGASSPPPRDGGGSTNDEPADPRLRGRTRTREF